MESATPFIAVVFIALLIAVAFVLVSAVFLLWGARLVGIENRSFGKALITTVLGGIVTFILTLFLSIIPVIGQVLGFIAGFFITALIMVPIFKTTFGKALGAALLSWVLSLLVVGGITLLLLFIFGGLAVLSPALL